MTEPSRATVVLRLTRRGVLATGSLGLIGFVASCARHPAVPPTSTGAAPVGGATPASAPTVLTTPTSPSTTRATLTSIPDTPVPATATPTPAPQTLSWWTERADSGWLGAARAALAQLKASRPELTVQVTGGYGDYGKIVQGFAIGRPPNAFEFGDLVTFADRGIVRPLDAYLGQGVDPKNYFDAMWANAGWRGKVYGIPALDHGPELGLIWNSSLVGAGLPDSARATETTLSNAARTVTKRDGSGTITFLGFDPLDGVGGLLDTARDLVGQDWVDLSARSIRLATPPYEQYLNAILGYYQALGLDKVNAFRENAPPLTTSADSSLNVGKEGMVLTGYWSVGDVARLAKDSSWSFTSGWAPTLTAGTQVQRLGGRLLGIPAATKEPDGGWELLRFLASDPVSAIFLDQVGTFAATRSFVSSTAWSKLPGLRFWIDSLGQATRLTSRSVNVVSGYAEAKWEQTLADVLAGNRSPHDALAAAQTAIDAELKRFDV